MNQITQKVTISQAERMLEEAAALYFEKDDSGSYRLPRRRARPLCLIGPAGIGKTEIVEQVAKKRGLAFLSYSITHHTRQSAIGLPRLCERTVDGISMTMTEYTMSEIIAQVYHTMEGTGKREGILFLDEFNCASETMRPIMLRLLQEKAFGPHLIPDGWMLVLAGNPPEYNRAVIQMDSVTADRLRLIYVEPDYESWRSYALEHSLHAAILSYLDNHRENFYVFATGREGEGIVTPRGWEDLSLTLYGMEKACFPVTLGLVAQYLQVSSVARDFFTYYQHYADMIASGLCQEILAEKNVEKNAELAGKLSFTKSWALVSLLMNQMQTICNEALATAGVCSAVEAVISKLPEDEGWLDCLSEAAVRAENKKAGEYLAKLARGAASRKEALEWFRQDMAPRRTRELAEANGAVEAVLRFSEKAFQSGVQTEFLINSLAFSPQCGDVLAQCGNRVYQELYGKYFTDPAKMLQQMARQVRRTAS